jgi:hypothetical protein
MGTADEIARAIGMIEHKGAVEYVLATYFECCELGFYNKRCDEEIERFQAKQAQKVAAGKASAERRANARSTSVEVESNKRSTNQEPITNNQDKLPRGRADEFELFWSAYPRKEGKGTAIKAWGKAIQKVEPQIIIERVERWKASKNFPEPQFLPMPASWLNAERWSDEFPDEHKSSQCAQVFVQEGTPEWDRWKEKRKTLPVTDVKGEDGRIRRGWYFPTACP